MRDLCDSGKVKSKRERQGSSEQGESVERKGQVTMRDLKYLIMGLEASRTSKSLEDKGVPNQCSNHEISEVSDEPVANSMVQEEVPTQLDLNAEPCIVADATCDSNYLGKFLQRDDKKILEDNSCTSSRGLNLELNAEDIPSQNPSQPYKKLEQVKSKDVSECASTTTSPSKEKKKDSFRIWTEMKQNGFLSSSHGGIPVPKQCGRKNKKEALMKKRLELARKEQADKFAKLAAPSGLLNELNPGIINHVRNKRQVHSIIEALVKSEKASGGHTGNDCKEVRNSTASGNFDDLGGYRQRMWHPNSINKSSECEAHSFGPDMEGRMHSTGLGTRYNPFNQKDSLGLELSASMCKTSEISMSNEGSANLSSITSLSIKAATISSQWLELLHQDIKGRLAALKRSKKRVQGVISTELPFLIAKEFSSNQESNPFTLKNCTAAPADAHRLRWSGLFDQMDKALSEEEQQLEVWLNQVKEMQMHCEHGLQSVIQCSTENMSRSGKTDSSERELAVRAAAASIYSTCNFLLSKEDVSFF